MERARQSARGDDIKKIKDNINKLYAFDPPLSDYKEKRGFQHEQVGELLLSPDLVDQWKTDAG